MLAVRFLRSRSAMDLAPSQSSLAAAQLSRMEAKFLSINVIDLADAVNIPAQGTNDQGRHGEIRQEQDLAREASIVACAELAIAISGLPDIGSSQHSI